MKYIEASASISSCGRYRWKLLRRWKHGGKLVCWIMCNPSTANAVKDDQTIRKCVGFADRWGAGAIVVANIFAYRATDPRELASVIKYDGLLRATGPGNGFRLVQAAKEADLVVAAWGGLLQPWSTERGETLWRTLPHEIRERVFCLGFNHDGSPRHPRVVAYAQELEPWPKTP